MRTLKTLTLLLLFPLAAAAPFHRSGLRELVCRGNPGMDLRITGRPSPDNPKMVRMTLRYPAAHQPVGMEYQNLQPGTCSWNPGNVSGIPRESGVVNFDIPPEAQPWFATYKRQMDTTSDAGAFLPDTISLPRYLAKTDRYYKFFVDDQTNFAISYGHYKNPKPVPTYVTIEGPVGKSGPTVAELRCRGGYGLFFTWGEKVGDNQIKGSMTYRRADHEAGPDAKGLAQATCAWVDRDGLEQESGRINFVTAGNAQIVQARTGGTVDKSPTAAVRYPDANTIPLYMQDPAHYWNFHVRVAQADNATAHAAWKPTPGVGERTAATSTERSNPQSVGNRERTPATSSTSNVAKIVDPPLTFIETVRKPTQYWMRFSARANSSPTVEFSNSPPARKNGRLGFANPTPLTVSQRPPENFKAEFVTAPLNLPQGGAKYYFVINVPAGANGEKAREYSGEFTTMTRTVVVRFKKIDLLNDSDTDSNGEVAFRYYLAPSPATRAECGTDERCWESTGGSTYSWGSNTSHDINVSLNISRVPDLIRVWVNGADDDGPAGDVARVPELPYGSSGGSAANKDYNSAWREINISRYQQGQSYPFRLRSVDGSVFMFEVHGEVLIGWK